MSDRKSATRTSRGLFVVLEGIDGSGTTTQARRLVESLEEEGVACHLTQEPSRGPVGVFLRRALEKKLRDAGDEPTELDWTAMALLFAADRVDHLAREIRPALERGKLVVSDRYDLSSLVYQSATSPEGVGAMDWLRQINARADRPDLTLVLDVDPEIAAKRRAARGGSPEMYEISSLQRVLSRLYADAQRLIPEDDIAILDASQPFEQVAAIIRGRVKERY